jgi:hypothetical protein
MFEKGEVRIMDKEEYYKRIEKINNRFKTDRVSADEEYQLVCQRNYLSTKYIENLEQQCKKQKEVINNAIEYINDNLTISSILDGEKYYTINNYSFDYKELLDILNEVSE